MAFEVEIKISEAFLIYLYIPHTGLCSMGELWAVVAQGSDNNPILVRVRDEGGLKED
jgi:hypothetical protein